MDLEDQRQMELETLEAIFPELLRESANCISLEIPVALTQPVKVTFPPSENLASATLSLHDTLSFRQKSTEPTKQEVCHFWNLPPLQITVTLPDGYPSRVPPLVALRSHEDWVPASKLKELEEASGLLWENLDRDLVLYSFVEHLQEAAEGCFGLAEEGTLRVPSGLKVALLDYDAKVKRNKFDNQTFECGVCLEPKKGMVCYRLLNCGHVFCVACLQSYYDNCIKEGDIESVRCMDPSCGKGPSTNNNNNDNNHQNRSVKKPKRLLPSELLQIPISEENVQRFVRLRKKRRLETNPNTVYCPRTWCQAPARVGNDSSSDDDSEDDSGNEQAPPHRPEDVFHEQGENRNESEKPAQLKLRPPSECLAVCTGCTFAFCIVCKRSWHGELGFCSVRHEKLYSREEKATEEYLKKYTTPCPTCNARAQKILGCNHMICRQCSTHFCYLCSSWLDSSNPYSHFNTLGQPCYQRLWELEGGDGEGAPERPHLPPAEIVFEVDQAVDQGRNERQQPQGEGLRPGPVPPPAPQAPVNGVRVRRRVQQGLARPAPLVPQIPGNELQGHGLQRFLELAERDEEDGWDSDELEDQFIQFVIRDR